MKVFYSNDFTGSKAGERAIVVADDLEHAGLVMDTVFKQRGLNFDGTLIEIDTTAPNVIIMEYDAL
jgi:hypothetical protein